MTVAGDFRARLEQVLACPTAPFAESRVHACIRAAVAASPRLRDRVDACGNLEVTYGKGRPRLLFACHTDHPAFESNGDGTVTLRGGMRPKELVGARLRALDLGEKGVTLGRVLSAERPVVMALRGRRRPRKGAFFLPDLPDVRFTKSHIRARVIDDLCSVAACLAAMDRLARARFSGCVGFLFTRAEEVGFAGALGWVKTTRYPRSTTLVNLEMSRARKHAPQGAGPILRVGDRLTVFDAAVTLELEATARGISDGFRYQRALMDGGACEATVFAQAGFRAGALCLPLQNTHNQNARGEIAMEQVRQSDAENLVRWIVAHARRAGRGDARADLDKRLEKLWRRHRRRLDRTAAEGEG